MLELSVLLSSSLLGFACKICQKERGASSEKAASSDYYYSINKLLFLPSLDLLGERRSAFEWCKLRLYFNIKPINTIITTTTTTTKGRQESKICLLRKKKSLRITTRMRMAVKVRPLVHRGD